MQASAEMRAFALLALLRYTGGVAKLSKKTKQGEQSKKTKLRSKAIRPAELHACMLACEASMQACKQVEGVA
jgi:hypothetical protein